ncbi:MAG: hypothetical protein ACFFFH_19180 [Candidatus Thorarchaeota archaeon]
MINKNETNSEFYECSIQLLQWVKGTDILGDIIKQIKIRMTTLNQLYQWKRVYLLHPKPTLNTSHTFVFWVHSSIVDLALQLAGVQGSFKVSKINPKLSGSSSYKGKKQNPRLHRILLDIGIDDPTLIQALTQLGLEVELVWHHAADLLNYEVIEICTEQYIDLLVSSNQRLLTPLKEWLIYLMPHRTRLYLSSQKLLESPKALAQVINERAHLIRKRKQVNSHKLQHEFLNNLVMKTYQEIQSN